MRNKKRYKSKELQILAKLYIKRHSIEKKFSQGVATVDDLASYRILQEAVVDMYKRITGEDYS